MRRAVLPCLCAILSAAWTSYSAAASAGQGIDEPHTVGVLITRDGTGWIADYTFDRPTPVWLFPRTAVTRKEQEFWRDRSFQVETPNVRLTRHGAFDVLDSRRGPVPEKVRIRFTPFAEDLIGDYLPAMVFTDGGVALFTGQFELLPAASPAAVKRLPADLNTVAFPVAEFTMVVRDGGTERKHTGDSPVYLYAGPTRPLEHAGVVTLLDPGLPEWIRASLAESATRVFDLYARELGPPGSGKPTLLATWRGPTPGLYSRAGGTTASQIAIAYEGEGLLHDSPRQRAQDTWFIAHEAAHFWLGNIASYEYARDAWITEGGADLLAVRALATTAPDFDWRGELDRDIAACAAFTKNRGLESSLDRNDDQVNYACGVVFGLVAEASSGRPFSAFVRRLLDENRADKVITRAEWLAALDRASGNPALSRDVARLLDRGVPDPPAFLAGLLTRSGLEIQLDSAGMPRLK